MILDCAIIGGGPAGLNAALVLGRARRKVVLIDSSSPRNAVTHESHGFITRDGVKPGDFRDSAHEDIRKYPSVLFNNTKVSHVEQDHNHHFRLTTEDGNCYYSRKIILATGLKEELPAVNRISEFYGKSLFSCPYCDGWELRDLPLVLIAESKAAYDKAKIVSNWSGQLTVCTNGRDVLSEEEKNTLNRKGIQVKESPLTALEGEAGQLQKVTFEDGTEAACKGGFVIPKVEQASNFGEKLGLERTENGGIKTDHMGRTSVKHVYAAGDTSQAIAQLIVAAAEGSKAAIGVNHDLTLEDFD
ncbi:NAD(P)/FAD-dependent oxidoreductase [Halobacillus litoralis]|uniref:NAD(P)/FAD-dependent oxidoreductase n=1 Tax=Halobacillus litoralis TaxID=45668 RepID=UPI00136EAAA4|nr:NAD(P)/FAD-dependent oxidoreductase [Halobacillus litoralis]MYL36883.1 FAD-binding protein [Halobacillus litoralis]